MIMPVVTLLQVITALLQEYVARLQQDAASFQMMIVVVVMVKPVLLFEYVDVHLRHQMYQIYPKSKILIGLSSGRGKGKRIKDGAMASFWCKTSATNTNSLNSGTLGVGY